MRVVLSAELEEFRNEVRTWIAAHRVPELEELREPRHRAVVYNISYGAWTGEPGQLAAAWEEWQRRNHESGYMCPHWPVEVGGRGWTALQLVVWNEELAAAGMPRANRGLGEHLVGPAVIVHGTPEQQQRLLPRVISGEDMYGQGFSEPDAGSDLASLRTRGVVDGDDLVIHGQKVWTSLGHLGNKMFLLCRTDLEAPKHRGISYVILDVDTPGVEMRRVRQMTGAEDFCEEFFDGARAPMSNVIGGLNNGWKVAMTVLGYERGQSATTHHLDVNRRVWNTIREARERGLMRDDTTRRDLMRAYARVELMRFAGLRILAGTAFEQDIERISSAGKVFTSEFEQELAELGAAITGRELLRRPEGAGYELDHWQHELLHSRCLSIQGGSNQVQRNILGERVLGLPKEPKAVAR